MWKALINKKMGKIITARLGKSQTDGNGLGVTGGRGDMATEDEYGKQ